MPDDPASASDTTEPVAPLSSAIAPPEAKPAARPDWLGEDYWDAKAGQPLVEKLAKAHAELGARFAKGKAAFADDVRGQVESETRAKMREGAPETPAGYVAALPKAGAPEHLVLLDKPPGPEFQPEGGKAYFVLDERHPLMGWWRETAHKAGLSQEGFAEGIARFASSMATRAPTAAEMAEANAKFYASLGERGQARAAHLYGQMRGMIGEEAKLFDAFVEIGGPAAVTALENLVAKAGGPRFSPGAAGGGNPEADLMALKEKMREPGYYQGTDQGLIKEVTEGFKRLYPGKKRAG